MTEQPLRPREPWIAVILSWLVSGLGIGYGGRWGLAAAVILLTTVLWLAIFYVILSGATRWLQAAFIILVAWKIGSMLLAHWVTRHRNPTEFETERRNRRDPFLAVFLSFILPGVGQLYLRRWLLGILFLAGFFVIKAEEHQFSNAVGPILSMSSHVYTLLACFHAWRIGTPERKRSFRVAALAGAALLAILLASSDHLLALAFGLRESVAVTSHIPTGSMAPQIVGNHFEYVCANCGYRYDVDYEPAMPGQHPFTTKTVCPLCFFGGVRDLGGRVNNGDHLLTLKYYYRYHPVERWDVADFKSPWDTKIELVKRVVGLPGETVEIRSGKVYINGQIVRKPDRVQNALWMPVYDSVFNKRQSQNGPDWRLDKAAQIVASTNMTITPLAGEPAFLTFRPRDAENHDIPITDFYGYDAAGAFPRQDGQNVVTDIDLRATVEMCSIGNVEIVLRAYTDEFHFVVPSGGHGNVRIIHRVLEQGNAARDETFEGQAGIWPVGKAVEIEAANVDQKLVLKVDGRRVIGRVVNRQLNENDDLTYVPAVERSKWAGAPKDWTAVKIGFSDATAVLSRLQINRDIYYTTPQQPEVAKAAEGHPYTLKADEFFVLGDNSPLSSDSRYWGPVPRANLLGKAHVIYWPPSRSKPIE